jgi:quinoprotein glucose dehydrogenase
LLKNDTGKLNFFNKKRVNGGKLMKTLFFFAVVCLCFGCKSEQSKDSSSYGSHKSWEIYKSDAKSSSYSKLTQINKNNVSKLNIAWTFHTGGAPPKAKSARNEDSPIVVDSVMYVTSPWMKIFALNAYTGKKIWSFDPLKGKPSVNPRFRSVVYWHQGSDKRILFTAKNYLYTLNAEGGKLIKSFGQNGKVNLNEGLGRDPKKISVSATSPGIVYKNLLIMGNSVGEGINAPPGYVKAYNIKTGKLVWTFHTIPKPEEKGYDTWPKDAWKYVGGVNDWAGMSLDKKRGMVFLALGSPTYDWYGADRKGKNLFSDCVVALNAKTGKLIWYYQTVHHDLWDYDLPAPPNLVTVKRDGKQIPAVAQVTKTGFVFLLDRLSGKPLFKVRERPVPKSDVPGEEAWPTQPFPLKPKPFVRQKLSKSDIQNLSISVHDSLAELLTSIRNEGLFTPPSIRGTLDLPSTKGGAEWGGAAYDPKTHILYVNGSNLPTISKLKKFTQNNNSQNSSPQNVYEKGKRFYMARCASCHGADRMGSGDIPALLNINKKMSKEQVVHQIKNGGGMMPAFRNISKAQTHQVLAYLFNEHKAKIKNNQEKITEYNSNSSTNKKKSINTLRYIKYRDLTAHQVITGPKGYPAIKPPWGTLSAINLNTGKYEWKIPLGNHSALKGEINQPTGTRNMGGPIVTAGGLVFIGATIDNRFRAYDKDNGKLLWETSLSGQGRAAPITYMSHGKQFVVISLSGKLDGKPQDTFIAFALPDSLIGR